MGLILAARSRPTALPPTPSSNRRRARRHSNPSLNPPAEETGAASMHTFSGVTLEKKSSRVKLKYQTH